MIRWSLFVLAFSAMVVASAARKTTPEERNTVYQVEFTDEEIQFHQENIAEIVAVASRCLDQTYAEHLEFFDKHGVSKFYGDRREQHQTRAGLIAELRRFGKPQSFLQNLEPISCIGLTLNCLGDGFRVVGSSETWEKITDHLYVDNKVYGTDLQILLQKLGWKIYYWNPSPENNAKWDAQDRRLVQPKPGRKWHALWGGHAYRFGTVNSAGIYYDTYVDDRSSFVGFGQTQPEGFDQIPFFVGIAHAGWHVFPGRDGEVIEAHSTRQLNARDNLEFSSFNPLARGGGPRWTSLEKYRSGLIAIPPVQ